MIIGLDLSLTSTGYWTVSARHSEDGRGGVIKPKDSLRGVARLEWLRAQLYETVLNMGATHAVLEGYSYGSRGALFDIGEWGGLARWQLMKIDLPIYIVPPQNLKQFVTGKGSGKKEDMKLWAYKRWGVEFKTNDECDAYCLAMMGLAFLHSAEYVRRHAPFTEAQAKALVKVQPYYLGVAVDCRKRTRVLQTLQNNNS